MASGTRCQFPPQKRRWATRAAVMVMVIGAAPVASDLAAASQAAPPKGTQVTTKKTPFQKDILPIFERNCLRCHDTKKKKGGLDLSTPEAVLAGGESGPAVLPKQPAASRLYNIIQSGEMPLDGKTKD